MGAETKVEMTGTNEEKLYKIDDLVIRLIAQKIVESKEIRRYLDLPSLKKISHPNRVLIRVAACSLVVCYAFAALCQFVAVEHLFLPFVLLALISLLLLVVYIIISIADVKASVKEKRKRKVCLKAELKNLRKILFEMNEILNRSHKECIGELKRSIDDYEAF